MNLGIKLFFISILFFSASCSSLKEMIYFQDKNAGSAKVNIPSTGKFSHIIAVGDVISLVINTPLQTSSKILEQGSNQQGFAVKGDSTIELPVLGIVKLAGLTIAMAKDTLIQRAKIYFNDPYVNLQLISFKVTVLGEVNSPGIKAILSENGTLLDAIAAAGDLNTFGNRSLIKVLRGSNIYYLDLSDINVLYSQGFYLQSNDVVYVQPMRKKNTLANLSTAVAITSLASVVIALTSTIILFTK